MYMFCILGLLSAFQWFVLMNRFRKIFSDGMYAMVPGRIPSWLSAPFVHFGLSYNLICWVCVTWANSTLLRLSTTTSDMILNCVALDFITEMDNLVVPDSQYQAFEKFVCKNILQSLDEHDDSDESASSGFQFGWMSYCRSALYRTVTGIGVVSLVLNPVWPVFFTCMKVLITSGFHPCYNREEFLRILETSGSLWFDVFPACSSALACLFLGMDMRTYVTHVIVVPHNDHLSLLI